MGKALDAWQKHCSPKLTTMTKEEMEKALATADTLFKALEVARGKCNPKAQKETIAGVKKYQDTVTGYRIAIMKSIKQLKDMEKKPNL